VSADDGVVLFGVGSPVVADVEETLARLRRPLEAAIRNFAGDAHVSAAVTVHDADAVPKRLLSLPFLVALFTPAFRRRALDDARRLGFTTPATVVDPTSVLPRSLSCAEGVYVNAGCTIGAQSRIGAFVFINRSASIGHHADLDEFVSIGPGVVLAGQVRIGRGSVIGAGAVVLPPIRIGENAVISAGSVVTRNVADRTLVAGNPARVVRRKIAGYQNAGV
jgi:sugar O-acyltransferase (sialic acid O-acetyltransferase NeuD family)